jgi:hypothetical protein
LQVAQYIFSLPANPPAVSVPQDFSPRPLCFHGTRVARRPAAV